MRVGLGYDIHRLAGGRPFPVGGVLIESVRGPLGHSDGDVLLHATIDALLGAAGLGDIGSHFSPDDAQWKDVSSLTLVEHTLKSVKGAGYEVYNLDATVILERPKLAPYIHRIRQTMAEALQLPIAHVNVKAKTNEGLDTLGRGQAVAAHAVVLLEESA
ncbi:MAG TPA: 2-C-methyl-D-erythritol 2,4-cyclodiphosphate synthase [Dehalococcoidia bacterium]|nr:2-C-methyl-D-erythritol 2,4-cyclodiphosphate synthase [Dehalococcoidia bacterium]